MLQIMYSMTAALIISDQQGCPSCYYYCSTTTRTFGFDSERGTCTSLCPVSVEFPRLSRITPSFLGASISGSANSLIDSLAYQNRVDSQLCREPASGWLHSAAINGCPCKFWYAAQCSKLASPGTMGWHRLWNQNTCSTSSQPTIMNWGLASWSNQTN